MSGSGTREDPWVLKTPPGSLKVTIRKFYRASGASTQLKGVVPDIVLPSINNVLDTGEARQMRKEDCLA